MKENKYNDLTIVIPTLNEVEAIGKVIDEIIEVGVPRENILVVDGGSTDGTIDVVKSKNVRFILQEGKGKADAIRTAAKYINTEYTLVMDGDYTYPAKHIPELYEKIKSGRHDLVIGWRKFDAKSQPLIYRIGNKLLTKFFNLLFGTQLHDVLSGMYVLRTAVLHELEYASKGFGIESEIAAHVVSTTGRVAEVPIEYRPRLGKKKLGVIHGLQILKEMIRLAWRYNPTFLIFFMAALLLIPGVGVGSWVAYQYLTYGVKHHVKAMIAIALMLTGLQSLLLSILALYLKRMEIRLRKLIMLRCTVKNGSS